MLPVMEVRTPHQNEEPELPERLGLAVTSSDEQDSKTCRRDGASVTDSVLGDGQATYTPGISERRKGASTWLHSGLKNADGRTLADKSLEATRRYDAFGNVDSFTGGWQGPFGYAGGFGYQEDGDTGLKLLGHRYYDASIGRFISRDFVEAGRNRYAYCDNNPLKRVDENGLEWHDPTRVTVDKDFKGKVWVVGEPGKGMPQIMIPVGAGGSTPSGFDADIVIVQHPDGTQERYFVPGANGPKDKREIESNYRVGADGSVIMGGTPWRWYPNPGGGLPLYLPDHEKQPGFTIPFDPKGKSLTDPLQGGYRKLPGGDSGTGNWNDDIAAAKRNPASRSR